MRRLLQLLSGSSSLKQHRPFNELDAAAIRRVGGGGAGSFVNPGVRVALDVVSKEEEAPLVDELRALSASHGFVSSVPVVAQAVGRGLRPEPLGSIAPVRVTGRPEGQPAVAPWGYGDSFSLASAPPLLAAVATRIAARDDYAVGPLRDITVNYRRGGLFQLDPHLDPLSDGENVLILGLLSDVVLTLVPPGLPRRTAPADVAARSWTTSDLDVLLKRRAALLLSGDARATWHHAIRSGVVAGDVVCDWWGSPGVLLRRGDERISIVLAWGDPVTNA